MKKYLHLFSNRIQGIKKVYFVLVMLCTTSLVLGQTVTPVKTVTANTSACGTIDVQLNITGANPVSRPLEATLVIDVSGSMENTITGDTQTSMDYAKNAAVNFINTFFQAANNPTGQNRIGIVTYSTTATIRANLTASSGQAGLLAIVNGLNGSGTTNIQDGIVKGDAVMSAGTFNCLTARSMIVLSDGVANRTGTTGATCTAGTGGTCIQTAITAANNARTNVVSSTTYTNQIFAVGLFGGISGTDQTNAVFCMNGIQSGGNAFITESGANLTGIYSQIFTQLSWVAQQLGTPLFETETISNNFNLVPGSITVNKGTFTQSGQVINWNIDFLNVETITLRYRLTPKPNICGSQTVSTSRLDYQNSACVATFQNVTTSAYCVPCAPTVTTGTIAACYPTVAVAEAAAIAATGSSNNCSGSLTKTASTVGTCSAVITVLVSNGCQSNTTTYNTRIDNVRPVLSGQGANATINCPATPSFTSPTATDNCPGTLNVTFTDATTAGSPACAGNYTITRTWIATDSCGNISLPVSQAITVRDNIAPVLSGQGANTTINCPATPTFTAPTAIDSCGGTAPIITFTDVTTAGTPTCAGNYTITRTWIATDSCGNISLPVSQAITVRDNIAPVLSGQGANATINCPATPTFTAPTAIDSCGGTAPIITFTDATTAGTPTCAGNYTITRTWIATDSCGNVSLPVSQAITVRDITPPVFAALPVPTTIANNVTPSFQQAVANDTCSSVTLTFVDVPTTPNCNGVYSITRTWTATDLCNNASTASQIINVSGVIVIANNDTGSTVNGAIGGIAFTNVLTNDSLNSANVLANQVITSFVSSTHPGVTLVGNNVVVAAGTPVGNYTLTYSICAASATCSCDDALVSVSVSASPIVAQNDLLPSTNGATGNPSVGNVLPDNGSGPDTLNGNPLLNLSAITMTVQTPATPIAGGPVPTLNTTTGVVSVPAGTPAGTYTITYQICENLNPVNCDAAIIIIPVYTPAINLLKNGTYLDSLAPAGVSVGDTIVYNFIVTNTGGSVLTNITVTDPLVTVVGGPIPTLAVGASNSTTFTAVYTITQADIDAGQVNNLATATGTPPSGPPVTDTSSDPTPCTTCDPVPNCPTCTSTDLPANPSIELLKDGTYVDNNGDGITNVGDSVVYNFTVTNTGNVTLTNVTITDINAVVSGGPIPTLAVGASDSTTFTAVHIITQADIDAGQVNNLATATGTPPSGPPVTDTSSDPTPCTTCDPVPNCPTCTSTPLINAVNDTFINVGCDISGVIGNILGNDTIGTILVNTNPQSQVTLTILNGSNPNITIANNGAITVQSGIAFGTYNFTYQICSVSLPIICDQATVTINIVDTTPPTITLSAINQTVQCGPNAEAALLAWLANNGGAVATDTCSAVTWSNNFNGLSDGCGQTGTATVVFTANDASNNPSTTTATFTIEDTTPPTITTVATNVTVQCDGNGNTQALQAWLASNGGAAATDACSNVTWTNNFTALSDACGQTGNVTVIFTATDNCGNATPTTATFTIEDTTPPTITTVATNVTVQCDGNGNTQALQAWLASNGGAAATDACSNVTWTNNFTALSDACGQTGNVTVIFTATDNCGNATPTTATFTIEDTTPPTITTVATNVTVQCDGNGNTQALQAWLASNGGAVATDGCSNVTWTNNFTALSDACGQTGTATVIFTATDNCGNATPTTATFTIEDTTPPTITTVATNVTVQCDGNGNTQALQTWLASNSGAVATDGCSNVTWTNNFTALSDACGQTGNATVIFTATDNCGNATPITATFTIEDTTPPTITTVATNVTVQCDGNGNTQALQTWLASNGGAAATDACSNVTWTNNFIALSDACGQTGTATVIFTATDNCGNATPTTATFTIEDTTPPTITTVATNVTVQCDGNGNTQALQAWLASNGGAVATDACSNVTWTNNFTALSDACGQTGNATVIFTATDNCGNATPTTATFTIEDTTPPTITIVAVNSTIECTSTGTTSALNAWLASNGGAVANDACSNVTWTNNYTALSNGCGQTGSATVTFTATDDCGNATSTSAVFTIQDTTAPTLDPNGPALVAVINVACDAIPTVPQLQFIDGCSAFTEIVITQTSVTSTVSDTGTYTIIRTWTVSDACGNPTTLTQTVNVTIPNYIQTYTHEPVCNIDTTLIVDFTDVINEQFPGVISANGTWSEVGTTISGALNTSNGEFTPLDVPEGVYVIQYNNNDPICPRIIQITIEVDSEVCIVANCVTLTVHNAFTPNNDGINEVFFIDNITNPCYAENKVEIYNRWGVKVFDTENYNNIDKVFTGVSEGRSTIKQSSELPTGTYFYILKYKNIEGDYSTKNGYLYLSR